MTAVWIVGRIVDDGRSNGIQVDVRDDLTEVILRVDVARPVAALPEPPEVSLPAIELPGDIALESLHGSPQRNRTRLDDQMVVICHQAPGEHAPAVEVANTANNIHECLGFERVVKNELAARNAAIHVIGRIGRKRRGFRGMGYLPCADGTPDSTDSPAQCNKALMRSVVPIRGFRGMGYLPCADGTPRFY